MRAALTLLSCQRSCRACIFFFLPLKISPNSAQRYYVIILRVAKATPQAFSSISYTPSKMATDFNVVTAYKKALQDDSSVRNKPTPLSLSSPLPCSFVFSFNPHYIMFHPLTPNSDLDAYRRHPRPHGADRPLQGRYYV